MRKLLSGKPSPPKLNAPSVNEDFVASPIHQQGYMTPPARSIHRISGEGGGWEVVQGNDSPQIPSQYQAVSLHSHNSSFASLPHGASPPILSLTGAQSPSPLNIGLRGREPQRHKLRKKSAPGLRMLGTPEERYITTSGHSDSGHREREKDPPEKKERRGFWSRGNKDKDKEKNIVQDRRGRDDEAAMLTNMIGFLTATASEDWSLVSEVADRVSINESSAKEVAFALWHEFKYGEPATQLAAARLWAILLRNVRNDWFIQQSTTPEFTETIEDLLSSARTLPVVRERILDVIAAAAYASGKANTGFRALWKRVKPHDKPEEGIPLDNDVILNPPVSGGLQHDNNIPQVAYSKPSPFPTDFSSTPTVKTNPPHHFTSESRNYTPLDEDIRQLFQECKTSQGNASRLTEALAHSTPEDFKKKDIKELYIQCRSSQKYIVAQIPWASEEAEQPRIAKDGQPEEQQTVQEKLLGSLLSANAKLMDALHQYDDLQKVAMERTAEGVSNKKTMLDRPQLQQLQQDGDHLLDSSDVAGRTGGEPHMTSRSRSLPAPSGPRSPAQVNMHTYTPSTTPSPPMSLQDGYDVLHHKVGGLRLRKESVRGMVRSSVYHPEDDEMQRKFDKPDEEMPWDYGIFDSSITSRPQYDNNLPQVVFQEPLSFLTPLASWSNPSWARNPNLHSVGTEMTTSSKKFSLEEFPRYSSADDRPVEWLKKSYKHLEYINQSVTHTMAEECKHWINSSILFPYLITYLYLNFAAETATLEAFINVRREWDLLTALCRLKEDSNTLRLFTKSVQPGLAEDQVVKNLVALDTDMICVRLHSIMTTDEEHYRRLVNLQGSEAQAMLDLFQMSLDLPMLDKIFRSPFLNAMLRLSTRSGLSPRFLLQRQVDFEGTDAVSAGQFGDVWKGRFRGQQVAVKVLKLYLNSDPAKHTKKVLYEALIWRQLRHPNVLPFLCLHHVNNNKMRVGLVSPWMEKGNLKEFLLQTPDVDRVFLVNDVAAGLEYLHTMQPTIVHGDLKAVNILMSNSGRARLADFGLSTASNSQALKLSSFSFGVTGGTSRWMAPELLDGRQLASTTQTDVYSFAFVCFEIFSGTIPFPDLNDFPVMLRVMRGERPSRPEQCEHWKTPCTVLGLDDNLWRLIEGCWVADAFQRPTMSNVVRELSPRKGKSVVIGTDRQDHSTPDPEQWEDLMTWARTP